jgi:hypothetical protein
VVVVAAACGRPDPADIAQRELADSVRIEGFRRVEVEDRGGVTYLYLVGPINTDLNTAVSASRWHPVPIPSDWPNTDLHWEAVVRSVPMIEEFQCPTTLSRHRLVKPVDVTGLSQEELDSIAAGRLLYVQVSIYCGGAAPTSS